MVVDQYKSVRAMDLRDGQDGPRGILSMEINI